MKEKIKERDNITEIYKGQIECQLYRMGMQIGKTAGPTWMAAGCTGGLTNRNE